MVRQSIQSVPSDPTRIPSDSTRISKRYSRTRGPQARAENQSDEPGTPAVQQDPPIDDEPSEASNSGHCPGLETFRARVAESGVPPDGQEMPNRSAEPATVLPLELYPPELYEEWRITHLNRLLEIFHERFWKEAGTSSERGAMIETMKRMSEERIHNQGTSFNLTGAPLMMDLANYHTYHNPEHSFLNVYPGMQNHQEPSWETPLGDINGASGMNSVDQRMS